MRASLWSWNTWSSSTRSLIVEMANTRARARDMHRRIIEDDDGLLRFTRASQNIVAVVALL
jgi:hypothetical protein